MDFLDLLGINTTAEDEMVAHQRAAADSDYDN